MSRSRTLLLLGVILGIHGAVILGIIGADYLTRKSSEKKEIAFRVKLGGDEPSHAPEVGMPERTRPAPAPAPPPPEPEPPAPPEPQPEPQPVKVPAPVQPKPKPKPVKPKPKPKPKPVRQKPKPVKNRPKPVKPKPKPVKTRTKPKTVKPKTPEVYHDSSWDNFDPNSTVAPRRPGGSNFNRNVPIGSRDRGQKAGRADHRTPAGGASADEEKFWAGVGPFIKEKWVRPPGILVDESTAVTIKIYADASGRVYRKYISKPSPNAAVNASAEQLLKNLSYIPRPPQGAVDFEVRLISEQ